MDDITNIDSTTTKVASVHNPEKYDFGCKDCGKILASGTWVIGVMIGQRRFLVGKNPPMSCCGKEKIVCEVFDDPIAADALRDSVMRHLTEKKSTEGLMLFEAVWLSAEDAAKRH